MADFRHTRWLYDYLFRPERARWRSDGRGKQDYKQTRADRHEQHDPRRCFDKDFTFDDSRDFRQRSHHQRRSSSLVDKSALQGRCRNGILLCHFGWTTHVHKRPLFRPFAHRARLAPQKSSNHGFRRIPG